MSIETPFHGNQVMATHYKTFTPPQLNKLTEASLKSYLCASNGAVEPLQSSNPPSKELMAHRLVQFLKDNESQINREQVELICKVAQKVQLIGNNEKSKDFEKLVKQINKLKVLLENVDLPTKPAPSIAVKLENTHSWTSFFSKSTALKVGALFAAIAVVGLGFALLGQQNQNNGKIEDNESVETIFRKNCKLFISGEDEFLKLMKNDPYGGHFYCATPELQNNQKILLTLLKDHKLSPEWINPKLRNDREFMLAAGNINRAMVKYASNELKADKKFVLHAVEHAFLDLKEISEELQVDQEVVCAAFRKHPMTLTLDKVSQKLMDDEEFMLTLSKCHVAAPAVVLQSASPRLKAKEEFVLSLLNTSPFSDLYQFVSEELKTNQEFILSYLKTHLHLFDAVVPKELKSNAEFINRVRQLPG